MQYSTQNKLKYNVLFPKDDQQTYYPMLNFEINDQEKINELELIRTAVEADRRIESKNTTTIYIFSPPGLGKTVMGGYLAKCYGCPYQIINCVNSMIDLDLLGSQVLVGESTLWQDGPIPSIIRATNDFNMGILLINELNSLSVNAQMALNPLLDRQEGVVLTQNNNEFVSLENEAHLLVIATMNPDVLGINDLQDSVRDRASLILKMDYPPPKKEAALVAKLTSIDEATALKFCKVIHECRKAKTVDRTVSNAPSTRSLLDWIQYSRAWGPRLAFEMTVANRYSGGVNPEEGEVFLRIAHGKGVSNWNLDETFEANSYEESLDDFHFPTLNPIETNPKPPKEKPPKGRLKKKHYRLKKKAEQLGLQSLETFVKKKED